MNVVIPPLIFYVIGAALVVAGSVRALTLGRRNPEREVADDDPARARARRRHFTFGLIWVAMGLFLIASTAGVLRKKAETSAETSAQTPAQTPAGKPRPATGPSQSSPTLRLVPGESTRSPPPAAP